MKIIIALPLIFLLFSFMCFNVAQAEGRDSYIGIGAGTADTAIDGLSDDLDLEAIVLQLGVWMTDNISIEIRMGKGIGDDSVGAADVEIESVGGLYGTYHWNLGNQLSVYGIAGGSRASVKVTGSGGSVQDDENSLSYGAGIKISILSIEYMRYLDTSEVEADVASVGLLYEFD